MIECQLKIKLGDFILDVDFCTPAKGVTVVFGSSGCGKTTLLRALAGLEKSDDGFLKVGDSIGKTAKILYHRICVQSGMFFRRLACSII